MRIATDTILRCPLCGASAGKRFRSCPDYWGVVEGTFDYDTCDNCLLTYLRSRPTPADIALCYPDDYAPYTRTASTPAADHILVRCADRITRFVQEAFPDPAHRLLERVHRRLDDVPGVLIDYGCGSPAFLDAARAHGWQTVGIDFNPEVIDRVRAAGHRAFLEDDPVWREEYQGRGSVVRVNHALEHVADPVATVESLRLLLEPKGMIHIAVPNVLGISSRLFRSRWMGLEPRHLTLFSPETLARLLATAGFDTFEIAGETATKDIVRSLQIVRTGRVIGETPTLGWRLLVSLLQAPARLATHLHAPDRIHAIASG